MSKLSELAKSLRKRTAWLKRFGVLAVIVVPLALTGLFVGAFSKSDTSLDRIPAAVVNNDSLIYTTGADGTETPVFAGRQLVTELTSSEQAFDWTVTNEADAEDALAHGKVYAVLTIPKGFSESVLSIGGSEPTRGMITVKTDDAHSYLVGTLAETVGRTLADTFGREVTAQYIEQMRSGMGQLGESLGSAADGASSLSNGVSSLSEGLGQLAGGVDSARAGAQKLSDGINSYTSGVDALSSGLNQLNAGSQGLSALSDGVGQFTSSITALANALAAATANLQANPTDPIAQATVAQLSAQLTAAAAGGTQLASQVDGALSGITAGISQSASGASQLASGSSALRSGSSSLVSGLKSLGAGASSSADGAGSLAAGADELAKGLAAGAAQIPSSDSNAASASKIVADPVGVELSRANAIDGIGQSLAGFLVPLGLWIGALAIFLVTRPLNRVELGSGAGNLRLVFDTFIRAAKLSLIQAAALVLLLHTAVGVSWAALPATLGFALIMSLAFTAFHMLLTMGFGKGGLVVSILALVVQVTATGGLYPIEMLSTPFQWLSPFLPLTYGVSGMQAIIASGQLSTVIGSVLVLALFGVIGIALSIPVLKRVRRLRTLSLLADRASHATS
ncbi:MAG: YhgE/Pip family protein [Cryobacterium sp.]|nr:YhgE/Pip family protein [Cryobacterium sp.]